MNTWHEIASCLLAVGENVLVWGPPGTGKSSLVNTDYRVCLHGASLPYELVGGLGLSGGNSVVQHGPAVQAMLTGGTLVLDELDMASPEVASTLYGILDHPHLAQCRLADGGVIRPAAGFCVLGTMNASPSTLPAALVDRFAAVIRADIPSPAALRGLDELQQAFMRKFYACAAEDVDAVTISFGLRAAKRIVNLKARLPIEALPLATGLSAADIEAFLVGSSFPAAAIEAVEVGAA